ncbi:MAG TPA: N-acetyltransferase [Nitrospinota bacterium]|nr:N-acetyltransferase [Nitrospinota bacterium]
MSKSSTLTGLFRPAIIQDARKIHSLIKIYADKGEMLPRSLNDLFEFIRQYTIYEEEGKTLGVCGLHVSWEDLAEVRALAVDPNHANRGIGSKLLKMALLEAKRLGIYKVFALTYIPEFFEKQGFKTVDKREFPQKIWGECVSCHKFPNCDETGMIVYLQSNSDGKTDS